MTDEQWKTFFDTCASELGPGDWQSENSMSWCTFTTFGSLARGAAYWSRGLPHADDIGPAYLRDGGVWREPINYGEIAHIIVPKRFFWESPPSPQYSNGLREQDIDRLSRALAAVGVPHRLTDLVLEIKLY